MKKAYPGLIILSFLAFALFGFSVSCGDDDDDDDSGGTFDVENVEQFIQVLVDQLDTEGVTQGWVAYALVDPLSVGDQVQPAEEGPSGFTPDGEYWFAYIDRDPFADFEHEVQFVFLDGDTGALTVEDHTWWPEINGTALFVTDYDLVKVYGDFNVEQVLTSSVGGPEPLQSPNAPDADYGDAPDNTEAYEYGAVAGHFPTFFDTDNSVDGRPGGHTLNVGEETLGVDVSAEKDADDPSDPDSIPNMVNADKDSQIFWAAYPDYSNQTLSVRFLVQVSVAGNAPDTTRYINILLDHNRDGQWKKSGVGKEWLIENFEVKVPPGSTEWVWTDSASLPLTSAGTFGFESWIRVALTRSAIDDSPFGDDGWDGSGAFDYGEIEDHYYNFLPWYGDDDDDDDDDDNDDNDDNDDDDDDDDDDDGGGKKPRPDEPDSEDPEDPGASPCTYICETDEIEIPITCAALVINFGDAPGKSWMDRNGKKAQKFFTDRYGDGNSTFLNKPKAADALKAIQDFLAEGQCLDERTLYLVGHGGKSGYIRAKNGGGRLTVEDLNEAITANDHCPSPMDYYSGDCDQDGYCNINVIVQSCYSGNFAGGDDSIAIPGVNVLTSADDNSSSYGRGDGNGSYVSNSYWDAFDGKKADAEPNGDGDGTVSQEEAMKWAKENYGGPNSDAGTSANADCDCLCGFEEWFWTDPIDDLIYWYVGGSPSYIDWVDIVNYGIVRTVEGIFAIMQVHGDFPGPAFVGFHEFYFVFDRDPAISNYDEPGPTSGGDTAYIAQFLDGVWTAFLFVYDGANWNNTATTAGLNVMGDTIEMFIDPVEVGLEFNGSPPPVHSASWYKENGNQDAGDDSTIQSAHLPTKIGRCGK
jgi:hypothetical protein